MRLKEEEEGRRGRGSLAWAKEEEREGSFGWVSVEVDVVEKPWNWDVRSSY